MLLRKIILLSASAALCACSSGTPKALKLALEPSGGRIDLSESLPGEWGRVCVIPPYSTNEHASEILGIPLNIESKSSIYMLDSIALLVAMWGESVSGLFEVPRGGVDFTHLGGKCYRRGDARFAVPERGHPFATPVF